MASPRARHPPQPAPSLASAHPPAPGASPANPWETLIHPGHLAVHGHAAYMQPSQRGFSRLGLGLFQRHQQPHRAAPLSHRAWFSRAVHGTQEPTDSLQSLLRSRATLPTEGEAGQGRWPGHRPARFQSSTGFTTTCGDNSIKAALLKALPKAQGEVTKEGAGAEHRVGAAPQQGQGWGQALLRWVLQALASAP